MGRAKTLHIDLKVSYKVVNHAFYGLSAYGNWRLEDFVI